MEEEKHGAAAHLLYINSNTCSSRHACSWYVWKMQTHNNWSWKKCGLLLPLLLGWIRIEPLTNFRTHSGMVSLSTCTTVPSTWSQHVSFLQTYKGCCHAPRMFIIDQISYSFFLIPEFVLWASWPWPNHCCPTLVTLRKKEGKKTHSCQSPSSSEALFPWPEWPTSTPALTLMALAQLSPCFMVSGSTHTTVVLSVAKNGWTKLFLARNGEIQERKRNFINTTPSMCFKQVFLSLLTARPKQRISQPISQKQHPAYISAVEGKHLCLKCISCSGMQASPHVTILVPKIIMFCPVRWKLLSHLWWHSCFSN